MFFQSLIYSADALIGKNQLIHNTLREDGGCYNLPSTKSTNILHTKLPQITEIPSATKTMAAAIDTERSQDKISQEDAAEEAQKCRQRMENFKKSHIGALQ